MSLRRPRADLSAEAGSVFLETVVALALLSMVLAAAYRVTADGVVRHRAGEARRHALMVARSALAAAGSAEPLASGTRQGTNDGDIWRIDTQRCSSGDSTTGVLYCLTVSVTDRQGGAPLVTLVSRRLRPSP